MANTLQALKPRPYFDEDRKSMTLANNYLSNTAWLFLEHGLRTLSSLFIGIWMARYLGPSDFGLLSLAIAVIAIASTVTKLGLDGIVTREIVRLPKDRDALIGTALFLKGISSLSAVGVIIVFTLAFGSDNHSSLIAILCLTLVFQAFDVVDYYFMAVVKAKLSIICRCVTLFLGSLAKIYLILNSGTVSMFAAVLTIEAALLATLYILMYYHSGRVLKPRLFRPQLAITLLRDSFPLLLSGATILLYMRLDQMMISQMLSETHLGLYSAAIKLTEATYMIPMLVSASLFPLLQSEYGNTPRYRHLLGRLYAYLTWCAVGLAIIFSLFAGEIVSLTFGHEFSGSSDVLIISIWAAVPVFIGVAFSKHLLVENRNYTFFVRNIIGLLLNIVFNLLLIPSYGIEGAAFSTLASQIYVAFIHDAFDPRYREEFWFKFRAIWFKYPRAVKRA
ncbi:flippase [Luminiphilus sp.]|nr:flippase [Luminiphilus sp.]